MQIHCISEIGGVGLLKLLANANLVPLKTYLVSEMNEGSKKQSIRRSIGFLGACGFTFTLSIDYGDVP